MQQNNYDVQKATKKVIKTLNSIGESIYNGSVKKAMMEVAEDAVEVARGELLAADPRYTSQQITPQEAASEVQAVYNDAEKKVSLVATLDYSKRNSMYFLEYGAGLSSVDAIHTETPWVYKVRHPDNVHEEISYSQAMEYGGKIVHNESLWKLRKERLYLYEKGLIKSKPRALKERTINYETKLFNYKGNQYAVTASSKPIGYMKAARIYINRFASQKIAKSVSVYILRRTNRPVGALHYEPYGRIKDIY